MGRTSTEPNVPNVHAACGHQRTNGKGFHQRTSGSFEKDPWSVPQAVYQGERVSERSSLQLDTETRDVLHNGQTNSELDHEEVMKEAEQQADMDVFVRGQGMTDAELYLANSLFKALQEKVHSGKL